MMRRTVDTIQQRERQRDLIISLRRAITAVVITAVVMPVHVTATTHRVNHKTTFEDFLKRLFHASLAVD